VEHPDKNKGKGVGWEVEGKSGGCDKSLSFHKTPTGVGEWGGRDKTQPNLGINSPDRCLGQVPRQLSCFPQQGCTEIPSLLGMPCPLGP
jgi:hypothetical protein